MSETHEMIPKADIEPPRQMILHPAFAAMMEKITPEALPGVMKEMMQIQREWEAGEAKRAFTSALVDLKRALPPVINRDKKVAFNQTHYTHATLGAAMEAVKQPLEDHGFALTWKSTSDDPKCIKVTAILSHRGGHSEETTLTAPSDMSGSKSAVQGIGSTITYLQRYSALSLLGIATADMKEPGDNGIVTGNDDEKVDTSLNMKAAAAIVKAGKTREDAEKFVGRPISEWTGSDLAKLRKWIAPTQKAKKEEKPAAPVEPFHVVPKREDVSRELNAKEMKQLGEWMKKYAIKPEQMLGIVQSATGSAVKSAKEITLYQFQALADKFTRLGKGEIDLNPSEMKFSEPPPLPPEPTAAESGKTPEQLNQEAEQEKLPF